MRKLNKIIRPGTYKRELTKGFSAIELLASLAILAAVITGILVYTENKTRQIKGYMIASQAVEYASMASRYIRTHYSLLEEALSVNGGQSNNLIVTISEDALKNEGFIPRGYPNFNLLKQYPCLVINYDNNQLQAFLYYRDNGDSKILALDQLHSGLQHVGGMIGLYENGLVAGAGGGWGFTKDVSDELFIAHGTANPSYQCQGSNISNNSYVINLTSMLSLNNHLPKDDSLHQYPDTVYPVESVQNANTMESDLILDSRNDPKAKIKQQSNMIFQMNQNCVMNPENQATMQDYAESWQQSGANPLGCRNRQLGIGVEPNSNGGIDMNVTGFQHGGDTVQYGKKAQPYVGELTVASIQPTTQIAVGTMCSSLEIGKMAQQLRSTNPTDINNIYTSQVQCMYNPLCPITTNGLCYMPITTVTLQLKTQQSKDKSISANCPVGTFISAVDADNAAIKPSPCCGVNGYVDWYCCHIDDCPYQGRKCSEVVYDNPLSGYSTKGIPLFSGIHTTVTHWYQGCPLVHTGCSEDWHQVPDTYIIVRSITCTNDITQIYIPVQE